MRYIIAIDQSTSATKAVLFDDEMRIIRSASRAHRQIVLPGGWVEHDPEEIYRNTLGAVKEVIEGFGIDRRQICCAALTNQRETALVWDRETGRPLYNAIVWHCARAVRECEDIRAHAEEIMQRTGLNLSPYYSAAKLKWILNHTKPGAYKNIACGTMDSWLIYKLTRGEHFKTDHSNASRTQLYNIDSLCWDEHVCGLFGIPYETLPDICGSDSFFGETDFGGLLDKGIPVRAAMGDSSASLLGLGCLGEGQAKCSYGTGSSIMINMGSKRPAATKNTVTSVAWHLGGKALYASEGNITYTGAVISWLRDDAGLISSPQECETLARNADQDDTTYLVPAFSGLGAPYWDAGAKAAFLGMTRSTGRAELVKAAVQSIAFQIADVLECIGRETGVPVRCVYADGGASKNSYLMQFQSDITGIPLFVSGSPEISATGAALAAGAAMSLFDISDKVSKAEYVPYNPDMAPEKRESLLAGWHESVDAVLNL